jgi:hypothetical protein
MGRDTAILKMDAKSLKSFNGERELSMNTEQAKQSAERKMQTGAFLNLMEVAALLDVEPLVIQKLPLPSIRIDDSPHFNPANVGNLIAILKSFCPPEIDPQTLNAWYYGMKYHDETGGAFGYLVNANPEQRIEWSDVNEALNAGKNVMIKQATPVLIGFAEARLEQFKASAACDARSWAQSISCLGKLRSDNRQHNSIKD